MGLEANIRHVTPYVPGEQPRQKVIKLNTNENPYPPAPGAMEMLHQMDPEKLRMYPDPEIKMLTECLASRYQVRPEQVFVGVGSDDVLAMSFFNIFQFRKAGFVSGYYLLFLQGMGRALQGSVYMPVSGWNHAHQSRRLLRRKRRHHPCESQRNLQDCMRVLM